MSSTRGTKSQVQTAKQKLQDESPSKPGELSSFITELQQLRLEINEVKQQNTEIKSQMCSMSITLKQTLAEHSNQLQKAEQEIALLKSTVGTLQLQLAAKEQDDMKNHLEITGIAEQESENLGHIVTVLSQKVGVNLVKPDIEDVVRVGFKPPKGSKTDAQNKRPRPIVLKLVRRCKRDEILKSAKSRRNVTSEQVVPGNPTKVFFNDRLTKENRHLFREARIRTHDYGFRYCWVRGGFIYVRKGDGSPAIRVTTHHDLDEKVGPAKAAQETTGPHV